MKVVLGQDSISFHLHDNRLCPHRMVSGDFNIIVSTIQACDKDSQAGQYIEQDTEDLWCMSREYYYYGEKNNNREGEC